MTALAHLDDAALVAAAKLGDSGAMRALYDRHAPRVYAVVRRIAPEESLADDWAQETWVRAFRGLSTFRGDSAFGTWLLRIAINSALHEARRVQRRWKDEVALHPSTAGVEHLTAGASREFSVLVDHAFRRGVQLILVLVVAILVATIIYRYVAARIARSEG